METIPIDEVIRKIMSLKDERNKKKQIYRLVNGHTLVCWLQEKKNLSE